MDLFVKIVPVAYAKNMKEQNELSELTQDTSVISHSKTGRPQFFVYVAILIVVLLAAVAGVYVWQHQKVTALNGRVSSLDSQVSKLNQQVANLQNPATSTAPTANPSAPTSAPGTFSGTITADECATSTQPVGDVGCTITVNSYTIQVKPGNMASNQPWGSLINFPALPANPTGKSVEVYAHQTDATHYTLEGSASYYVKITN